MRYSTTFEEFVAAARVYFKLMPTINLPGDHHAWSWYMRPSHVLPFEIQKRLELPLLPTFLGSLGCWGCTSFLSMAQARRAILLYYVLISTYCGGSQLCGGLGGAAWCSCPAAGLPSWIPQCSLSCHADTELQSDEDCVFCQLYGGDVVGQKAILCLTWASCDKAIYC